MPQSFVALCCVFAVAVSSVAPVRRCQHLRRSASVHCRTPAGRKIKHIVVIVQENRTFDNFFDCFPGTDCVKTAPGPGASPGPSSVPSPCPVVAYVPPGPTPTPIALQFNAPLVDLDPDHDYCSGIQNRIRRRADGRILLGNADARSTSRAGLYTYRVTNPKQIRPYWDMATQYVLADRVFPTEFSGSYTAHQDLIRGDTTYANRREFGRFSLE